jgi:hypothetical protein
MFFLLLANRLVTVKYTRNWRKYSISFFIYWTAYRMTLHTTLIHCVYIIIYVMQYCSRYSCQWGETMSLNFGHQWGYCSFPRWYLSMESHSGMMMGRNQITWRRTCPSATLSTAKPILTDLGSNPGFHGERLVTNRLSHGTT